MRSSEREDLDARRLKAALEEHFSDRGVPDLRHRILIASEDDRRRAAMRADLGDGSGQRQRIRSLLVVAIMLFCLGLWWVSDQVRRSELVEHAILPRDAGEFVAMLAEVEAISIRALQTREHSVDLSAGQGGLIRIADRGVMVSLRDGIQRSMQAGDSGFGKPTSWLKIHLTGGRVMSATLYGHRAKRWEVQGLGVLQMSAELAAMLEPWVEATEIDARRQQGIVFAGRDLVGVHAFPADLKSLTCYGLSDSDMPELVRFTALESLDLSGCAAKFSDVPLVALPRLPMLKTLALRQLLLSDELLEELAEFPALAELDLTNSRWMSPAAILARQDTKAAKDIVKKTKLQSLPNVAGSAFAAFETRSILRRVDLSYSELRSDGSLRALARIASLESLILKGRSKKRFSELGLRALSSLPGLVSLDLRDCDLDLDDVLSSWAGTKTLINLNLGGTGITPHGLTSLPVTLQHLDLTRCFSIDSRGLVWLAKLRGLRFLSLQDTGVTVGSLDSLRALVELRDLNLRGLPVSSTASDFLGSLLHLERLDLGFTPIDDQVLARLASLPSLRELNLVACDGFGDVGMFALATAKNLRRINLTLCDGFSAKALAQLRAALPGCTITYS